MVDRKTRSLTIGVIMFVIAAMILTFTTTPQPALASPEARSGDALQNDVRAQLKNFTDWLSTNSVRGYIGEVGWPKGSNATEADEWNRVAESWYDDADAAGLSVTDWSTGNYWSNNYNLLTYTHSGGGVSGTNPQATVVGRHLGNGTYKRGITVSGGEFGVATDGTFSNNNPGIYGQDYFYDPQATFTYLASQGFDYVRIPFRWERIQPTLGAPLNTTELTRLQNVVTEAGNAGLKVVLDVHNYGQYYLYDSSQGKGIAQTIGSAQLPISDFTDLWTRLSTAFSGNSTIMGYGLMNEPHGFSTSGTDTGSNLVTNSGFETNVNNWSTTGGNASKSQDTTLGHTGSASLKITATASGNMNTYSTNTIACSAAQGYHGTAWVHGTAGRSVYYQIDWKNSANSGIGQAIGPHYTIPASGWMQIEVAGTAPTNTAHCAADIFVQGAAASEVANVDDVTLDPATVTTGLQTWQTASQQALSAVRGNNDNTLVMVAGYAWSGVASWASNNGSPWITDPSSNYVYEGHSYWDSDNSGTYAASYATELANAQTAGFTATGTSAPTGSITINSGASKTASTAVTLNLTVTDDVDQTNREQVMLSNDSGFSGASWQMYTASSSWTLTTGSGSKTVYAQFRDAAGNTSGIYSASITLDTSPPAAFTPTLSVTSPTSTTTPAISFSTSDNDAVNHYDVKVDSGSFSTQTSPYTLPTLSDGSHTVTVRAYDIVGNYTDEPVTFTVDTTAPIAFTPAISGGSSTTSPTPQLTFSTTDATSGIDHYQVKVDSGSFSAQTSPYTLPSLSPGLHSITVRAFDGAGNTRDGSTSVTYTSGLPTFTTTSATPSATTATITWTTSEATTGNLSYGIGSTGSMSSSLNDATLSTQHSLMIPSLVACSTYHFVISAATADSRTASTSTQMITTICPGPSTAQRTADGTVDATGGHVALSTSGATDAGAIFPSNATAIALSLQVHELPLADFLTGNQAPDGYTPVGSFAYDINALDATSHEIDTFTQPVNVSLHIPDGTGTDDLKMFHLHQGTWESLDTCQVVNNEMTCPTLGFSVFVLASITPLTVTPVTSAPTTSTPVTFTDSTTTTTTTTMPAATTDLAFTGFDVCWPLGSAMAFIAIGSTLIGISRYRIRQKSQRD